jgi:excisionase family DNA binding protein
MTELRTYEECVEIAAKVLVASRIRRAAEHARAEVVQAAAVNVPRVQAEVSAQRLYSVATVAELLEVSKDWVYDRITSGAIAVVELGDSKSKQRIAATELQRFIDSRTYGASR